MPTITSTEIALLGAFVSLCSLAISARLAWLTKFSPPRLLGTANCLVLYTFTNDLEGTADRYLAPMIWVTNTGAKPMLVQDIRLIIHPDIGKPITLHPTHSVPPEAITSVNTFQDYEQVRLGLSPFGGFAVLHGERWESSYAFALAAVDFDKLRGSGLISFEVKRIRSPKYEQVLSRRFSFVSHEFSWLKWAGIGGPSVDYFYPADR